MASCKKLQDHCLEVICEDPLPFITTEEFLSLDKDILYSLLKRGDLQAEEAIVWDYLIKWGINQIPFLSSNRAHWNDKNCDALKNILNQFIPLIRFSNIISSADFLDKVR